MNIDINSVIVVIIPPLARLLWDIDAADAVIFVGVLLLLFAFT